MEVFDKKHVYVCVLVAQSCLTLCNPMDGSLPGSSVHGILQERILPPTFPKDLPHPEIDTVFWLSLIFLKKERVCKLYGKKSTRALSHLLENTALPGLLMG